MGDTKASDVMKTTADLLREEGQEQGRMQGRDQERRELLTRQLKLRFGELPADVHQRLAAAAAETLLTWAERVITARTLDEVLAD